jgi:hypothetical protein
MRLNALELALKDFGALRKRGADPFPIVAGAGQSDFAMPAFGDDAGPEPVDTDALIAEAVAQAEEALAARLAQEHAEALEAERERHSGEIAEINRQFAEDASARIAAGIKEMEDRVVELTTAVTARLVGVVLTDDLRDRSIARLAETIRGAIHDNDAVRIRVRGSQSLFEALQKQLAKDGEHLDFAESSSFDLSVAIDESVFETRLAEWSSALAEALS